MSKVVLSALIAGSVCPLRAQQTDASISPSVSLPARAGASALGGLALTLAGNPGFALRASGQIALKYTSANTSATIAPTWSRPWTADVDALFALAGRPLGSRNRSVASYGFFGMGKSTTDTTNVRATNSNWSYGVGSTVPLGASLDLFAEWRWRMSKLVLPTARSKPARSKEVRFGMSFHLARSG